MIIRLSYYAIIGKNFRKKERRFLKNYILPVSLGVVGPESRIQPGVKEHTEELKACAERISPSIADTFGETVN
jgi:hypothetical protein